MSNRKTRPESVPARILRCYPGKLSLTGGLVIAENALDLFYPLAAGIAIDAVIRGDLPRAFLMVGVIFAFWLIGALRMAVDTRVYASIYAEIVGQVSQEERKRGLASSIRIAHAGQARQFVDFFEHQVPAFATASVSIIGSVAMLLILQPIVGAVAAAILLVMAVFGVRYTRKTERVSDCLHSRQEQEASVLDRGAPLMVKRHFRVMGGRRIQLSDLEARAYVLIGVTAVILFGGLFTVLSFETDVTAGLIYTLMSYAWTFIFSLDDMPAQLQAVGKLRDIGKRVVISGEPEMR